MTALPRPPEPRFSLVRYFSMASLAVLLPVAAALLYFDHREDDLFKQVQQQQNAFFAQMQDSFVQRHDAAAPIYLLRVYEAGNANLARLFGNALWDKDFAPFVARAQRIPVDRCRAIADGGDAGGKSVPPGEKQACFAEIGKQIMALPDFKALDAKAFDLVKKSTVLKIKVLDLRGVTVYSSEHSEIGEDKTGNAGWQSAATGKLASQLVSRGKVSTFEGEVANRDVISSYVPVRAPGSEKIVAVFEVYSDITQFLGQIKSTSSEIREVTAANRAQMERVAAANQGKLDAAGNWMFAIVLSLLALFYCALFLIVRNGQRIIDKQDLERKRTDALLAHNERRLRTVLQTSMDSFWIADTEGRFLDVNDAYCRLVGYRREELLKMRIPDVEAMESPEDTARHMRKIMALRHDRFETRHRHKDGHLLDVEISVDFVSDQDGARYYVFMHDITERKRVALALARRTDLYHMLSQTNQAIVRITSREELFSIVCRVAVEHGRFRFAWIGLIDKGETQLKPVARYGEDAGYVDQLNLAGDTAGNQQGLTGQILLSGTHVVSNDFLNDPLTAPWHEAARRAGVGSSAKFPIREGSAVIGAISIYAGEPGFFTKDVLATLDEMAIDLSFALDNFAHEAARRSAEEAVREGEDRYRRMFAANPEPMWVYDLETLAFRAVNDAAVAHYGWSREQFLAMTIADIRPAEDASALLEYVSTDSGKEFLKNESERHRRKDGMPIDVEITSHLIDFGGRRARIVSVHDVTERKRTEISLRAAEEQFRGLVEQSIAGIYILRYGTFAYVNPRFAEIFGYSSADELIGHDLLLIVAEKDHDTVVENIRRRAEGEERGVSYGFTGVRKDGATVEIGAHGAGTTYQGEPAIIGLIQDISEKKRDEEKIQQYVAQLEKAFMRTVEVATTLSEMRDPYTAGHERRVAEIAVAIGAELGFDARRQEGLRVAGYLHDLGKISIPSEILAKPGKLTATEYLLIQGHAQASYDILKNVEFPWPVAEVALQHHERMDGSGYPQSLKGEAILLESRIMSVADVIESMSSHRPYRPGIGIEKALAEIERGRGTAFDADVADACLRLFREKGYTIPT